MIHDIPKPEISPAFTIDDIHKIREWHYERLKDATPEERSADTERRAAAARKKFGLVPGLNTPRQQPRSSL
ncbi:MAG: hypothetical protein FWE98_05335 [Oscillospiraceae bacterium]|nr:hypothetical protein [Oscillospiraceae bacterium]